MDTRWGQAMDVKVQAYKGNNYITLWHGGDNGAFGKGFRIMVCRSTPPCLPLRHNGELTGTFESFANHNPYGGAIVRSLHSRV
ncbi:hypothetical protein QBC33DRAFT_544979 [Phialemonium atrogriseum]|uniref:Uncharacterized protein n=1 Tax=Phialemonium atrogriseum TaxID=1093897 RepID=A0AAJ0BXJ0_9PEZI|nr:uncharacterized protein QBC33DRAFT_544979 [Phialemonium atrogriseum]KAK1765243.1 hypothetical protein QBC33DRAFT_544979 [Phialemonium atrogriseum]